MAEKHRPIPTKKQIYLLVADDSLLFKRVLREIFAGIDNIKIIGEASNGVEALDLAIRFKPDVVIMDLEMPQMDGMTSLRHLLLYQPTPVIMVSSLSEAGSARSFDAIKGGAVDFVYKGSSLQGSPLDTLKREIASKVLYAAQVQVNSAQPMFAAQKDIPVTPVQPSDIIFCEECGAKNIYEAEQKRLLRELRCDYCGDLLEENPITKYRRINQVTVLGAGQGSYSNLLTIIPKIPEKFSGTILTVISAERDHVDRFTNYLDAISNVQVYRMADGMNIEGGKCYIASSHDNFYLKPYSTQYTVRTAESAGEDGPIDIMMNSTAFLFKEKVTGIVLSGAELDGARGSNAIMNNDGLIAVLDAAHCLCTEMGENILRQCIVDEIVDENSVLELICNNQPAV